MFTVYMHLFPNGKRYIGITSQKIENRWRNGRGYSGQFLMNRAIKKYGWENIEHIVLAEGLTREEASEMERFLIEKHRTTDIANGYNLDTGGLKGYQHTERSKLLTSQTKKKNGDSVGAKNPMYGTHRTGEQNPFYGKHHTEETKERMKKNHADVTGDKNPFYIQVFCDGKWYGCLREFAEAEGYNKETIGRWVRNNKVPQKYKDRGFIATRRYKNAI